MIDDTYIAFVVPRGRIEVDGRGTVWDLDAEATDASALRFTWADASTSLVDWINSKRPPVLMEHGDGEHGTHVFGYAIDAFVATAEQARAAGVDAPNLCESVYARVRPSDELADLRERGRVGMTSPGLVADYVDDGERRWPIVVRELSHTWSPRMRDRQPSPESLLSATLSDGGTMETEEVIEAAAEAAAEAPDLAASVTMLAEQVATLTARVEALEGGATAGDTAAAAETAPEQAAVMSDSVVRRIVADESAIKADVDAARRARVIPESHVATLTDLRRRDPKAFKAAVGLAPMRQPQQRVTLADEQTATLSDYDRARVTAKEKNILLADALRSVRTNGGK